MLKHTIFITCILILSSCSFFNNGASGIKPDITVFPMESSIRAITTPDENTCWFAGSNGLVGHTINGGDSWVVDTLRFDGVTPEFRSIVLTNKAVMVLSVGSPALLYKSIDNGESWELVYKDEHPDCFYNAMTFWDDGTGMAIGDPIDGYLSILYTKTGGNSWQKPPKVLTPKTVEGEAGFAASNTNITGIGNHIWVVSGGKAARVFHSYNRGQTWEIYDTPIQQGGKMTGIFSVDFYDENMGIIWGGDWENQENNTANKAITYDGGKSWELLSDSVGPGYRSCVQFIPKSEGKEIMAVGIPGISYSANKGQSWVNVSDSSFYTVRINESGNSAWLAGKNKIAKMTW